MTPRLTAAQVAEQLHVEQPTVCLWAARKELLGYKVGRQWLFEQADVDAYVLAKSNKASARKQAARTTTRTKRRSGRAA